jgi:subtilase family serine protease
MRTPLAASAVVIVTLVAISLLVSGHTPATPGGAGPSLPVLVTDAVALPAGVPTTTLSPSASLEISLTLAYPHPEELSSFLSAVENPASPYYREYLTHQQFETAFAPTPSTVGAVVGVLDSAGGTVVTVAPDRLSVVARLSAGSVNSLLGVHMVGFSGGGGVRLYTAAGTPSLPASIRGLVSAVTGLSDAADLRFTYNLDAGPLHSVLGASGADQFVANNTTGLQWYVGSDYTQAFHASQLFPGNGSVANATYPTDVAIATLLASAYNESLSENLPPWDPNVIEAYYNDTLAPGWPVSNITGVPVTVDGVTPPLPGSFGSVNDSTLDEFENSLDLEMAGSLAPGAPLYNFYFGGSLLASSISDADVASYFDQDLSAALSYNYSPARLGVVSGSFGIADLNDSTWNDELDEAAAMGVTVVAASGDQGNAPDSLTGRDTGQWPGWPATAAFNNSGAVSVGGVTLTASGTPSGWFNGTDLNASYDPDFGVITQLSAWWDTEGGSGAYAGSEGGISGVYTEPEWQFRSAAQPNIVNATIEQGAGALGRAGPDIAFPGNATIAYVVADTSGNVYFTVLEGTSIAAPAFAGFMADEIAVAHHQFGYVTPELYRVGSYFAANPGRADPYYDVTNGTNYVFAAGPGWDATTGWGTPVGPLFYAADANSTIADYAYAGPSPTLPLPTPAPPVPWTEIFIIFGVGATVAITLVIVMARPPQNPELPPPPPFGQVLPPAAPGTFPGLAPGGATFLCPYCGAMRPAEPVRCPRCGAL